MGGIGWTAPGWHRKNGMGWIGMRKNGTGWERK